MESCYLKSQDLTVVCWTGYVKVLNFQLEVMNILETRAYDIYDEEKILGIRNWLGKEGLLPMETFTKLQRDCSLC